MSQNDFNIANQGFPSFRSDLNGALQALASNSSGTSAPATTYAYMWWYDSTNDILKMRNADNDAWIDFASFDQTTDTWSFTSATVSGDLTVDTDTLYVDSTNNRVGIGTNSPTEKLEIESTTNGDPVRIEFTAKDTGGTSRSAQVFFDADTNTIGFRNGGTNALHADSSGNVLVGTTSTINATTPQLTVHGESDGQILELYRPTSTAGADCLSIYTDVGGTENRNFYVEADGDTFNTNNSYGGISDERYKQDIVDAQSQWNDIKSIEIKNYRLKNMVEHMGDDAPVHLGVIAQQLEGAGMGGLVSTSFDEESGLEKKAVKYSVLYMKAIGALQEAMNKIDDLETRVAALEAK